MQRARWDEYVLELLEREGLDEVGSRIEVEGLPFCRKDARENDRAAELAHVPCEAHARKVAGLDHCRIDVGNRPAVPVGVYRLVSKPSDDVLQEGADVGMRFDDQDPCHAKMIGDTPVGIRSACEYEYGVNDGARILIVDDDAEIRLLLNELLSRAGFQVEEAVDGKSALRKLFETPPALVILDVTMPEMDGYQTLERIRDLSDVPVIMLTARTQELERVRGLRRRRRLRRRSRSAARSCSHGCRRSYAAAAARPR